MSVVEFPLDEEMSQRHADAQFLLWNLGVFGQGCRVAVIDDGVDQPSLDDWRARGRRIHAIDLTARGEGALNPSPNSHGYRIIKLLLEGAPATEVFSLRVYGEDGATREDFVRAMAWCAINRIAVANISSSFYSGCAGDCELCRAINTAGLAADVFTAVACGNAYIQNEKFDRGSGIAICPARCGLAWGVASSAIVAVRGPLASREGGWSFATAKLSAGVALLRAAYPSMELMLIRAVLQRTCIPHTRDTPQYLGFGRHGIVLAYFCAGCLTKARAGKLIRTRSLAEPSTRRRGCADENVCQALEKVCSELFTTKNWTKALEFAELVEQRIAPWAPPLERALVSYVRAALLEGLGRTMDAADAFRAHMALWDAHLARIRSGEARVDNPHRTA
jgi:hypothetical protein